MAGSPKDSDVSQFMTQESPFLDVVSDSEKAAALNGAARDDEDDDLEEEEEEDLEEAEDSEEESEEEDEDSEEESEEDEESDEEEEGEEEPKASAASEKPKDYRLTLADGSQVKVSDDTTIKIKENGKFVRISVRDLVQDRNGKVKHDELIRRGAEKEKQLRLKVDEITAREEHTKNLTKAFLEGVTKGDLIEAMMVINEMTGGTDPQKTLSDALSGIGKAIDEITKMTPEELERRTKNHLTESELKKKTRKLEGLDRDEQVRAAKIRKRELCEQLSLKDEDMNAAYSALMERNRDLKANGRDPINFTMEDVAVTAMEYRDWSGFKAISEEHEVDLSSEDLNNLIDVAKVETRKKKAPLDKKDYMRILGTYANKELKDLSRKVSQRNQQTTPKSKEKKKKKAQVREIHRISQIWD